MIDITKQIRFSDGFCYIESNKEVIIMPQADSISIQAYTFSDCVGKDIASGIYNHLNIFDIVEIISNKYIVERKEVERDVLEIISYLLVEGVVTYND